MLKVGKEMEREGKGRKIYILRETSKWYEGRKERKNRGRENYVVEEGRQAGRERRPCREEGRECNQWTIN